MVELSPEKQHASQKLHDLLGVARNIFVPRGEKNTDRVVSNWIDSILLQNIASIEEFSGSPEQVQVFSSFIEKAGVLLSMIDEPRQQEALGMRILAILYALNGVTQINELATQLQSAAREIGRTLPITLGKTDFSAS